MSTHCWKWTFNALRKTYLVPHSTQAKGRWPFPATLGRRLLSFGGQFCAGCQTPQDLVALRPLTVYIIAGVADDARLTIKIGRLVAGIYCRSWIAQLYSQNSVVPVLQVCLRHETLSAERQAAESPQVAALGKQFDFSTGRAALEQQQFPSQSEYSAHGAVQGVVLGVRGEIGVERPQCSLE